MKAPTCPYLEGCTAPSRDEKPASRRRGRTHRPRRRRDQVLHRPETGTQAIRRARAASSIFVTKRGRLPGQELEDLLDAGRDRLGHHLEVPVLHPARRQTRAASFYSIRHLQRPPAGRQRHQDGPPRQEHVVEDHLQGHLGRPLQQTPIAAWCRSAGRHPAPRNFTNCDSFAHRQTSAALTPCPTSRARTPRPSSSMKPPRRRSPTISSSTACSAACRRKKPSP